MPGMCAEDCNLQVAINESCVLERHSWNRKTFFFFLGSSNVLIRTYFLTEIFVFILTISGSARHGISSAPHSRDGGQQVGFGGTKTGLEGACKMAYCICLTFWWKILEG